MGGLAARLGLLVLGFVMALLLAEVVLRATGLAPEVAYIEKWRMRLNSNPKIGFEPIPNLDSSDASLQFFGYRGLSNSLGFRDRDHPVAKLPGRKRILVLGDSVTAGLWIEKDEDVLPAVLERNLVSAGRAIDVLNFGVLGYNTQQEVETLREKGLRFDPELVVLAYCLNDRWRDDGGLYFQLLEEEKKGDRIDVARAGPWVANSALFRFGRFRVLPALRASQADEEPRDPERYGADTVDASFATLSELARQRGFEVLVVAFPDLRSIEAREPEYPFEPEHRQTARLAREHGFLYLDLLPAMRACKESQPDQLLSFDRFHPRPLGYRCAADAIGELVMREIWPGD